MKISKRETRQQQDAPDNSSKPLDQLSRTIKPSLLVYSALSQAELWPLRRHNAELRATAPAPRFTGRPSSQSHPKHR